MSNQTVKMMKESVGKLGRPNRPSRVHKRRKTRPPCRSKSVVTEPVFNVDDEGIMNVNNVPDIVPDDAMIEEDDDFALENDVSAKKLKPIPVPKVVDVVPECNIFINTFHLKEFFEKLAKCPTCGASLSLEHEISKRKGLAHFFKAICSSEICEWTDTMATSKQCESTTSGPKPYEVNLRSCVAFRETGKGLEGMETVLTAMNSPQPMDSKSFRLIYGKLHTAYTKSAEESMIKAAEEVVLLNEDADDDAKDVRASFDGSWQRRGYSSLNGVIACISNGKVVDYDVRSKVCNECQYWKNRESHVGYEQWKLSHNCCINHIGSAGSMEAAGVLDIYKRSIESRNLRYMKYLGDGDSKAYQDVVTADLYEGKIPEKEECVGHVQKRVGARLRSLKNEYKGINLKDGKRLTGQGRLTEKAMNILQNYYGMVIRNNTGNLYQMKKGVAAILFHCSEYLDEDGAPDYARRHQFCPPGEASWCMYQRDQATGESAYKPKINIAAAVREVMEPIFSHEDLGADDLLKKCLHGLTQNPNEAFNQIIWKRAPKDVFINRRTLEIATASAVLNYNDGAQGLLRVFDKLLISPGHYTLLGAARSNKKRIAHSTRKATVKGRQQRKRCRGVRKNWIDAEKRVDEVKGKSYSSGAF